MATIKLGSTKSGSRLINYAEKRAEVVSGVDCPPEYAKAQMNATRQLWGKTDGVQAHHVIQSFKPGEVSPEQANAIGRELAKAIGKGYECVVYTHADKAHIHNHIVINSVSFEDGHKYQSTKKDLYRIRKESDRLCQEHDLSIVKEKSAPVRYTLSERSLLEQGKDSWKDDIRQAIDSERGHVHSLNEFKKHLQEQFSIDVRERGKNLTFTNPDNGRKVRGARLGRDYEKEMLENEFTRNLERDRSDERRGVAAEQRGNEQGNLAAVRTDDGDQAIERPHEKLHQGTDGQRGRQSAVDRQPVEQNPKDRSGRSGKDDFDLEQARRTAERLRQSTAQDFTQWRESTGRQNRAGAQRDERDSQHASSRDQDLERPASRGHEHGRSAGWELER